MLICCGRGGIQQRKSTGKKAVDLFEEIDSPLSSPPTFMATIIIRTSMYYVVIVAGRGVCASSLTGKGTNYSRHSRTPDATKSYPLALPFFRFDQINKCTYRDPVYTTRSKTSIVR